MYTMTELDRQPREFFGKTYFWSADDAGTLHLVSLAKLAEAQKALADG